MSVIFGKSRGYRQKSFISRKVRSASETKPHRPGQTWSTSPIEIPRWLGDDVKELRDTLRKYFKVVCVKRPRPLKGYTMIVRGQGGNLAMDSIIDEAKSFSTVEIKERKIRSHRFKLEILVGDC